MALVGPPNPQNQGRGQQEDSGVGTVWMQLCRSFASRKNCACIGVLGIASERSQLCAILIGSQNVNPEDGTCVEPQVGRGPLWPSQVSSLSAFALVGRTQTPETRPVDVCAYQVTNIDPCGRSARTRHQSRHRARFSHCLVGSWATNRPCSSGRSEGETRAKASATTSLTVSAERSPTLPRQAYRETSM